MPEEEESFDPYRFGHPDTPPPPEFAPPGYRPPPVDLSKPQTPASQPPSQYPGSPYPGPPQPPAPYQYGTPYPPYQPGPQLQRGSSGKAVAGMVLGIVSIVLFWTTIIDVILIILAAIFSGIGLSETKDNRARGRGQAVAGLVCAAIAATLVVVTIVLFLHAAGKCGGISNQDSPGFNTCVENHIF